MKVQRSPAQLVKPHKPSSGGLVPLSSSDLLNIPLRIQVLYAFKAPAPQTKILHDGLSQTLSEYPEFAGRLSTTQSGRPAVVLNDAGAALMEAQADGPLDDLWPFTPCPLIRDCIPVNEGVPELFLVQLTGFTCGGMTVGIASHHDVADGQALFEFMNAWGFTVRGLPIPVTPVHDRSFLMPRDPPQPTFDHIEYQFKAPPTPNGVVAGGSDYPDLAIANLHFSAELLKKIKAEAVKGAPEDTTYSTFVSLLAHLWRCITKARGLENEEDESRTFISVNVRERINPPLPKGYFGNAICVTCPHASIKTLLAEPLSVAANLIHDSIKSINNDYVRSALDFIEIQNKNKVALKKIPFEIARTNRPVVFPNLIVTSWVTLPLYELDFGTGSPVFAGNAFIPTEGLVILGPSPKRDGSIDVVLGLFAPHMEKLESICFDLELGA